MKPCVIDLKGNEKYRRLLGGPPETAILKSGLVTLKPGESVGVHVTEAKEEAIIVLKGKACVSYADTGRMTAEANSFVYIPPETKHDVKNIGDGELQYVYVVGTVLGT